MLSRRTVMAGGLMVTLVGCGPRIKTYTGPPVTRVIVQKEQRRMYLMHNSEILKAYKIDLGYAPNGHKSVRGDGKTPEGSYFIDRRNPKSAFHLSLGISYPNEADIAAAEAIGENPGGDIFIHGARRRGDPKGADWTAGCISVSNKEVEEIYSMVRLGTQIDINP